MTMPHGVGIDTWHLALLTPIVLAWFAWELAGRWAARRPCPHAPRWVIGVACVLVAVNAIVDPLLGLAVALWPVYALRGVRDQQRDTHVDEALVDAANHLNRTSPVSPRPM